jgi:hypothetical protein
MSIDNYSELQAEIANWLKRVELVNDIPNFIVLAEAQNNRVVRTTDMETRSQATADAEFLGLPIDCLEIREIHIVDSPNRLLAYYTPQAFQAEQRYQDTGAPTIYTVIDNQIRLHPAPSASSTREIEITYVAKIPRLTVASPTNWLLTNHPDIYLYGSLVQAETFLYNDKRVPMWKSMLQEAVQQANIASGKRRVGAGPMMPRVRNVV